MPPMFFFYYESFCFMKQQNIICLVNDITNRLKLVQLAQYALENRHHKKRTFVVVQLKIIHFQSR